MICPHCGRETEAAQPIPDSLVPLPDPPINHLDLPMDHMEISQRPYNCLSRRNIETIGEVVQFSEWELLAIKNFGAVSLAEVKRDLEWRGLSLRQETKDEFKRRIRQRLYEASA